MDVTSLGYIGLDVADPARWRSFATGFLGLMDASPSDAELRFRADVQAWRIAVGKGDADDLAFAGFEVAGAASLADVCNRLASLGFETKADDALARRRGVAGLARATDPRGVPIELYFGAAENAGAPVTSPAGVSGFLMGAQGLGHIVLFQPDLAAAKRFYMEGLGFRLSDTVGLEAGPDMSIELTFLHCNPRHHTLALVPAPHPKRLHHIMLQVDSMEDVGMALDRAERMGVPIAASLGRHTNDRMLSFYVTTPSGFQVEYGWGARTIGTDWTAGRYDSPSSWGHKGLHA